MSLKIVYHSSVHPVFIHIFRLREDLIHRSRLISCAEIGITRHVLPSPHNAKTAGPRTPGGGGGGVGRRVVDGDGGR